MSAPPAVGCFSMEIAPDPALPLSKPPHLRWVLPCC